MDSTFQLTRVLIKLKFMIKKILISLIILTSVFGCEKAELLTDYDNFKLEKVKKEKKEKKEKKVKTFSASLYVKAEDGSSSSTRAYDGDLVWHWEYGDALLGYQVAVDNLRNRLVYDVQENVFSCSDFTYQTNQNARFHFVYPYGAEFEMGKLTPVQDGVWRPVCYTTTEPTKLNALPTLTLEQLSSALEIVVWNENNYGQQERIIKAELVSESDFIPVWTLDESSMVYSQSLNGKHILIDGLNTSVVQINMPDLPEGYNSDVKIKLVLTREDGKTMTSYLPSELKFFKRKRTVYNVIFTPDPSFICATFNIDGLPVGNSNGPTDSQVKQISSIVSNAGWDIVGFQENFSKNNELKSNMGMFKWGTYKSFNVLELILGKPINTDGLSFATTCSFENETIIPYTNAYGGLTNGADELLKKGFRYYLVTLKDGVQLDVYVTHMNSGSTEGHINARASQLQQLANYINDNRGTRPIVILGDFNARYTRDDFATNFWNVLDADLYANLHDPWADIIWDGYYPEYGTPSWVVSDKYDPTNTVGDLKFGEQDGEIVDKILYINVPESNIRIFAKNYKRDMSFRSFSSISSEEADHVPVVVEFGYEKVN